jgi:hypothetical protein
VVLVGGVLGLAALYAALPPRVPDLAAEDPQATAEPPAPQKAAERPVAVERPAPRPAARPAAPAPAAAKPVALAKPVLGPWAAPGQAKPGLGLAPKRSEAQALVRAKPPAPAAPAAPAFKRRQTATEVELRKELTEVPEVGLGAAAVAVVNNYALSYGHDKKTMFTVFQTSASPLLRARPDLRDLPLRDGVSCQLKLRAARTLRTLSRKLRAYLNSGIPLGPAGRKTFVQRLRRALEEQRRGRRPEWLRVEAVPTLTQMLMAEDVPVRQLLVELLGKIPERPATVALAGRAVFDLNDGVRQSAVAALRGRKLDDYRDVLQTALRYPWAPAADHAAEALVALGQRAAVPELIALLHQPDPAGVQVLPDKRTVVREVVRINHLANCVLCHPPTAGPRSGGVVVPGIDPLLNIPSALPAKMALRVLKGLQAGTVPGLYDPAGRGGCGMGGSSDPRTNPTVLMNIPLVVRADITFLRQDFSLEVPGRPPIVLPGGIIPNGVRFDYVVRTRKLTAKEGARLKGEARSDYPQRQAVLWALRELTGKDAGPTALAWQRLFPGAADEVRARRLADQAVKASGLVQASLLIQLRDGTPPFYTQTLGAAARRLEGPAREQARKALTARLARLGVAALRAALRDDEAEVRQAALRACAQKKDRALVGDLIALLEGADPATARLALSTLRELTGESFGEPAAWRAWWKEAGKVALGP